MKNGEDLMMYDADAFESTQLRLIPHTSSPRFPPSLLRSLPRQTLNTITNLLKSHLVLLRRVLALLTLDLLAVVPLHLESSEDDTRVEAVDVFGRVAGEASELLDEVEEGVDVIAVRNLNISTREKRGNEDGGPI